ncbi:DUF5615 family PIN-like protein [Marinobacteraceae bacterium S3BR75-40.1]
MVEGALCPCRTPRFLCDEMLRGVGQWLRVAGYDTRLPEAGWPDEYLLEEAQREDRWLVTADRDLLAFAAAPFNVIYLAGEDQTSRLRDLTRLLDLDWCHHPFSRCKACNTRLVRATEADRARLCPPDHQLNGDVLLCPRCQQLFWEGSHVRRMRQQLEHMNHWRRGDAGVSQPPSDR